MVCTATKKIKLKGSNVKLKGLTDFIQIGERWKSLR